MVRFDLPLLGSVDGLRAVHLQCHIATDTVSLARLGAEMTGLDFSAHSLAQAVRLSELTATPARFVQAEVYDALSVLGAGSFDAGDHLRVWRGYFWHHGIYVGDDRVVQFGGGIFDKKHACVEYVCLSEFLKGGRVEVVPEAQQWIGMWGMRTWRLPPALPREEIVRRARWLADRRFEGTYNLVGRNCETVALWCVCNFAESLQRQRFQSINASVAVVAGLTYAYLDGRRRLPAWAPRAMCATLIARDWLLFIYYRHNKRFYKDVAPYYAEYGRS